MGPNIIAYASPDELNRQQSQELIKKSNQFPSFDDEILWPVQINIMSFRESSWISVKVPCELNFSRNFNLFMLFGGFHLSTPAKWHENNRKVCEKQSESISRHFTNDDEILSIANFDSLGRVAPLWKMNKKNPLNPQPLPPKKSCSCNFAIVLATLN